MDKYLTKNIENELNEKGFFVYNYISFNELFLTVKKDYLSILTFINIPFGIIFIISFVLNPIIGLILIFIGFLIINFILFLKLIYRSYYFLLVSDIIYTKRGIILGKEIFKNSKEFEKKISKYEKLFNENLGSVSNLNEIISEKKSNLILSSKNGGLKILNFLKNITGNNKDNKVIILGTIGVGIYTAFIYIFYYVGYFLGIVFFFIFSLFLKIIINYTKNTELEIKKTTLEIDKSFKNMSEIYLNISQKINSFTDGEIGNLGDFIEKNFKIFYLKISESLKNKNHLITILNQYKHKDFIDFITLDKYIKNNFNKPINDMIFLLDHTEKNIQNGLKNLKNTKNENKTYSGNLEQKEVILNRQLEVLLLHKEKFKKTLL